MNKSARKQFQDLLKHDTQPRSQKTTNDDLSDDLAKQFDDGTPLPSAQPTTGTAGTSSTPGTGSALPVAPMRDYMKVANSIHRDAAPAGLFKGKGKLIYDYLYSRTRGAIVPTRTVQASWREIMKAASIGSDKTLREHLKLLRAGGLITWEWAEGSQGGSVYTVYLPEEATGTTGTPGTSSTTGASRQILPPVPLAESTTGTGSLNSSYQRTSDTSKTFFKTSEQNIDDEAAPASKHPFENFEVFANSINAIDAASKQVTGKGINPAEASKWSELFEVLITELKIAAGRTTVSSVPAFLAEHLRRRLWKKDAAQLKAEIERAPQVKSGPGMDTSECPDCSGTGWEYPEGFDKGVRRCQHSKLQTS